jgi:hypothetical protein
MIRGTNPVSALLWILLAVSLGGGYWAWRMIPAYHDAWTVDAVLRDASLAARDAASLEPGEREQALHEIVDHTRVRLMEQLHGYDPDLRVALDIAGSELRMTAEYHVTIDHPGVRRAQVVTFRRSASTHL